MKMPVVEMPCKPALAAMIPGPGSPYLKGREACIRSSFQMPETCVQTLHFIMLVIAMAGAGCAVGAPTGTPKNGQPIRSHVWLMSFCLTRTTDFNGDARDNIEPQASDVYASACHHDPLVIAAK